MQKRVVSKSVKAYSITEIFLLVTMSIAIAFILGQEVGTVSAEIIIGYPSGNTFLPSVNGASSLDTSTGKILSGQGIGNTYKLSGSSWVFSSLKESSNAVTQPSPILTPANSLGSEAAAAAAAGATKVLTPGAASYTLTDVNQIVTNNMIGQGTKIIGYQQITDASGTKYIFSTSGLQTASGVQTEFTLTDKEFAAIPEADRTKLLSSFKTSVSASATAPAQYGYSPLGGLLGTTHNFFIGNFLQGLQAAVLVAGMVGLVASLLGADSQTSLALSKSVGAGIMGAKIAQGLFGSQVQGAKGILLGQNSAGLSSTYITGIGIAIAVAVFIATYKKEKQELVSFQCLPFEPQLGGSKCEQCNSDPYRPCSEYRCKALGQACELLNPGTSHEACAWVNPKDVTSPTITPWNEALKPTNLVYNPDNAARPGSHGVKIMSKTAANGCLQAFTPLQFGVTTNEPAQCKIDYTYGTNFSDMKFYFGDNYYSYNHTEIMSLPSPNSTDNDLTPLLRNDGSFNLYVSCQDANGNANKDLYSISFCVQKAPDTTPPVIESTSITDGSPVQANADSTPIQVFTNEPATCKWSKQDRAYNDMENDMSCAADSSQINADLQYECSGKLTGIADMQDNTFYFRCKDKPSSPDNERNTMTQSYKLTLRGTQELGIVSIGPNGTIAASTSVVPVELHVETDDGADTGKSVCYFSPTGNKDSYVEMYQTNDVFHKQPLSLTAGNYNYFIRCVDAGGNSADGQTSFTVEVDNTPPAISRVYKETDALKIITNEDAQCVYSLTSCNYVFSDGLKFDYASPDSQTMHITPWKVNSPYYIKCKDAYGNEPSPNSCSIIAAGLDFNVQAKTTTN